MQDNEQVKGKGQPRAFENEQVFYDKFIEYINYCKKEKRFSNIAGFCAYNKITRETFYKQKEYYSDTYNIVNSILEDEVLQDNSYRSQLYLKNKFGYTDRQDINQTIGNKENETFKIDLSSTKLDDLKELIKNDENK